MGVERDLTGDRIVAPDKQRESKDAGTSPIARSWWLLPRDVARQPSGRSVRYCRGSAGAERNRCGGVDSLRCPRSRVLLDVQSPVFTRAGWGRAAWQHHAATGDALFAVSASAVKDDRAGGSGSTERAQLNNHKRLLRLPAPAFPLIDIAPYFAISISSMSLRSMALTSVE
jgi:hypothetical protein